jgi:integrase
MLGLFLLQSSTCADHALRHTHASALIASGLDVLTISRRLGHASPAVTLTIYGHLFRNRDREAADAIEVAPRTTVSVSSRH